jgi:hypothetical protein
MELLDFDGFRGALAFAGAAAEALVLIYECFAVFHFNCLCGACALAGFAAKALFGINFCCHVSFLESLGLLNKREVPVNTHCQGGISDTAREW